MRSALNKLKPYFGSENLLGIYAVLLIVHLLYYIITAGELYYLINPYEFGMGILTDLFMRADFAVFKIIRAVIFAGALFVLFLLIRKVLGHAGKTGGVFSAASVFCCVMCIFPVFITGRIFSYTYTFSVHLIIIILTLLAAMLMLDGRSRACVVLICAVCEFFYAGFIFTYFPAVVLFYVYESAGGKPAADSSGKKNGSRNSKKKNVHKKNAAIGKDYFPVYLTVTATVIFILLILLTPELNKSVRNIASPVYDTNDQTVFYDSIDETRRGDWNTVITARRLDYIVCVLPFAALFAYIWISAVRLAAKEEPGRARFFRMCLYAELPAIAGVLFFREIGLWTVGTLLSQTLLVLLMIYKNDKTVTAVIGSLTGRLKQKKIYVFMLILFMFALVCCFYGEVICEIVRRNSL